MTDSNFLSNIAFDTKTNINIAKISKSKDDIENLKESFEGVRKSLLDADNKKDEKSEIKMKKASEDFEALLVSQMLNSMWQSIPKNGLFGDGKEEDYYREMLTDEISKEISKKGEFGIKDIVMEELRKRG